jgi:hypothetical protein
MSQTDTLLAALKRGERITTLEATLRFGICRLSERIRELERNGWDIDHEPVKQNGKRFVRYALKGQLELA